MKVRHVLSLADLGPGNLSRIVNRALEISKRGATVPRTLQGKIVGIYFRGPSTRTRTAFSAAAFKLGAQVINYAHSDLQLSTGESFSDTARVLSEYLDVLVVRTNGPLEEMKALGGQSRMAVINALSEKEHPTQAIADLAAIREALGRLEGVHILYIGEGNSTAAALALAVSQVPEMRLTVVTPESYGLPEGFIGDVCNLARQSGGRIEQHHGINNLPRSVDVVYTSRWKVMGVPKHDPNWRHKFEPYQVTQALLSSVSMPSGTIFLHDLPAIRGEEVVDEVLDGPQSRAFRQSWHKMTGAMALLEWAVTGE
ncbi:MAG: ornithine carbamoyltransferase [Blastocatellia bacterium]